MRHGYRCSEVGERVGGEKVCGWADVMDTRLELGIAANFSQLTTVYRAIKLLS